MRFHVTADEARGIEARARLRGSDARDLGALTMKNTTKAFQEYDAGAEAREVRWRAVEKELDVAVCEAIDTAELIKLQFAYWQDTNDRNTLRNCLHCGIKFMRMMAESYCPKQSTGE